MQKALMLWEDSISFQQNQNLQVNYEFAFLMRRYIFKAVAPLNLILAKRGKRLESQNWRSPSVHPIAFLGLPDCRSLLQITHNISQKLLRWKQLLNLILICYL